MAGDKRLILCLVSLSVLFGATTAFAGPRLSGERLTRRESFCLRNPGYKKCALANLPWEAVGNQPPIAAFGIDAIQILAGPAKTEPLWIEFGAYQNYSFANQVRAYGTKDEDGTIEEICLQGSWENQATCRPGNVKVMAPVAPLSPYLPPGQYTLTLTVKDNLGATGSDQMSVVVLPVPANNQKPVAVVNRNEFGILQGEYLTIDLTGLRGDNDPNSINMSGSFDPEGAIYAVGGCIIGENDDVSCLTVSFSPGTFTILHTAGLPPGTWSGYVYVEDITGLRSDPVSLTITVKD